MNHKFSKSIPLILVLVLAFTGCASAEIPADTQPAHIVVQAQDSATDVPTSPASPASVPMQSSVSGQSVSPDQSAAPAETPISTPSENPLAPEQNPPGDIPDTQVFVKYFNSTGGYELSAPEGWARTENGTDVAFIDKFDGVQVAVIDSSKPLTVDAIKNKQAVDLEKSGRAVKIMSVLAKKTKTESVVWVNYESNSEPDAVTGKQVRLEDQCYYFYKNGKLAALTMWAPLGADNVDQWKLMSDSFRWQ